MLSDDDCKVYEEHFRRRGVSSCSDEQSDVDVGINLVSADLSEVLLLSDIDFNMIEAFLENGCGCQEHCRQWQGDELVEMRRYAEIDFYENHVNKLDTIVSLQLHINAT
ncbi:hypothetical protein J6590_064158 [Homalodisca vitripennis]|nr:hypothetical protein J6590_064158 [Homalodisca vitripennis]